MTRPDKDYYRILQVHPEAELEVIQAAYRRLARMYHPDATGADGDRMREINEAYEVLSDPRRRATYDRGQRRGSVHADRSARQAPRPPKPATPQELTVWRVLLPTVVTLLLLVILLLDMFRLGVRGFPEITIILLLVGWLLYRFSKK